MKQQLPCFTAHLLVHAFATWHPWHSPVNQRKIAMYHRITQLPATGYTLNTLGLRSSLVHAICKAWHLISMFLPSASIWYFDLVLWRLSHPSLEVLGKTYGKILRPFLSGSQLNHDTNAHLQWGWWAEPLLGNGMVAWSYVNGNSLTYSYTYFRYLMVVWYFWPKLH